MPKRPAHAAAGWTIDANTPMAVALLSAASAHADQSVLTYHGALDRAGRYVAPGLTYERARGLPSTLHSTPLFRARSVPRRCFGVGRDERGRADGRLGEQRSFRVRPAELPADLEACSWPPVQRSALPCGNISPLGVTGAPVIDERRATLYLDAAVMRASGPRHEIFALSLADGSI